MHQSKTVENDGGSDDRPTPAGKSIRPTWDSWPCELERWLIAVNVSVGDGVEQSLKFEENTCLKPFLSYVHGKRMCKYVKKSYFFKYI